jgi:hypothetical protein
VRNNVKILNLARTNTESIFENNELGATAAAAAVFVALLFLYFVYTQARQEATNTNTPPRRPIVGQWLFPVAH